MCSADDLPFGDASFDSISVRFGYMFFPDVAKATAEFARVLRPGGRLCSSVWAGPGDNPWTTIAMQAIATEAVLAPPGPDGPGMFRCAAPGYVSALYQAAGLRDVAEWDVDVELVTDSPAQYWEMISEHVSLAVAALAQVGEPARERIAKAVIATASTYEQDGKVRIPGVRCAYWPKSCWAENGTYSDCLRTGQRASSSIQGSVPFDIAKAGAVNTVWAKARPKGCPGQAGEVIRPS